VQKVREASAKVKCGNNLHQLAIACHAYHDARGALPASILLRGTAPTTWTDDVSNGTGNFGPNWMVLALPFMEQSALYNLASATSLPEDYRKTGDQNWKVIRGNVIPSLLCPSDTAGGQEVQWSLSGGGWARGNYACNAGGIHQPTSGPNTISAVGYQSSAWGYSPSFGSQDGSNTYGGVPNGTQFGGVMCIILGGGAPAHPGRGGEHPVMLAEVRTRRPPQRGGLPRVVGARVTPGRA